VPRFDVYCRIEFSQEELGAIEQRKLYNLVVATFLASERQWEGNPDVGPTDRAFDVRYIIKQQGFSKDFPSAGHAQQWETTLRENILPNLKQAILGISPAKTFEL
jgi:hypothetical protein